ncbi:uncharacterized protein BP5553_06286 [Venustampulla echinocandica]|uniref:Uncharacterized protein n=1 Tax=Venustampulla echinocandica TaxID=2656787 RepID=A0A370TJH2_9HELO|nr:uncharacterized protein BP5553_06286 [Venustampulla echinocandica]RDL35674.1 hypothetical protein BP5553_06286 [Venustampulla echinocandica]
MSGWVAKKSMESMLGIHGHHEKENTGDGSGKFGYRSAKEAMIQGESQMVQVMAKERKRPRVVLGQLAANGSLSNYSVPRYTSEDEVEGAFAEAETEEETQLEECEGGAQEQPEDNLSTDAIRHAEAYAEMIRGAVHPPQQPQDPTCETPSRKRRRLLEIAASDASSSNEPFSPSKLSYSDPRRPAKRLCTPQSANRRRSAPSHVLSPLKPMDLNQLRQLDNFQNIMLKMEKTAHCDDRTFKPSATSVHNFEAHLKSKAHRANVTARISNQAHQNTFIPTSKTIDFEIPTEPLMVFAQKGQPDLETARAQYLHALQNDASSKAMHINVMQVRLASLERKLTAQGDHVAEILEVLKRNEEKYQSLSEQQSASESKHADHLTEIDSLLSWHATTQEGKIRELTKRLCSTEKQKEVLLRLEYTITDIAEKSSGELEDFNRRLTRSEKQNKDELEVVQKSLDDLEYTSDAQASHLLDRIQTLEAATMHQNDHIHDLEAKFQLHSEKLDRQFASEKNLREDLRAQLTVHFAQTDARMKALEEKNEREMKRMQLQNTERISVLERASRKQEHKTQGFEALIPAILEDAMELRQYLETISGASQETSQEASRESSQDEAQTESRDEQ